MTGGVELLDSASKQENIVNINQLSNELSQMEVKDTLVPNMATIADGGRQLSKNILYVGNINKDFGSESLHDLFSSIGKPFKSIKILQDKNRPGFSYAFVEYDQPDDATIAYNALNKTLLVDNGMKITYAFQTQQIKNGNTFNLFIGDLSSEVKDELLNKTFAKYESFVQANVMWDMKTGRSRGYGFACFNDKNDAFDALQTMNGLTIGDRPIKLNWASHRDRNSNINQRNYQFSGQNYDNYDSGFKPNYHNNSVNYYQGNASMQNVSNLVTSNDLATKVFQESSVENKKYLSHDNNQMIAPPDYQNILKQTPNWLSVVYLGNLSEYTTQNDLIPILQNFGYIVNFKILPERGCAFVTYDTHDRAALAIVQLSGLQIKGRPLKCGWGKSAKAPMTPIRIASNNEQTVGN